MKLWRVSQEDNREYDTYDSFVIACETQEEAICTSPDGRKIDWDVDKPNCWMCGWASKRSAVSAAYIGEARPGMPAGVVCASFNAG
jgi:hypothetical protein